MIGKGHVTGIKWIRIKYFRISDKDKNFNRPSAEYSGGALSLQQPVVTCSSIAKPLHYHKKNAWGVTDRYLNYLQITQKIVAARRKTTKR